MKEITIEELTNRILCADQSEILSILDAAKERFSELLPEQELLLLSVPGSDPDAQICQLQKAISLLASIT